MPGKRLVASHSSDRRIRHEAPLPTINDAFRAITSQLENCARKQRGDIKHHEVLPQGRIVRMFPDYGFIELADGREVYFHKNSIVRSDFNRLEPGMAVRVVIAENENPEGPQASTVEAIHDMNVIDQRSSPFKTVA